MPAPDEVEAVSKFYPLCVSAWYVHFLLTSFCPGFKRLQQTTGEMPWVTDIADVSYVLSVANETAFPASAEGQRELWDRSTIPLQEFLVGLQYTER